MPSKAQRAASRQGKLSKKKRRGKPAPQNFSSEPISVPSESGKSSGAVLDSKEKITQDRNSVSSKTVANVARGRASSGVAHALAIQQHLVRELIQIGIVGTIIVGILTILTFILR